MRLKGGGEGRWVENPCRPGFVCVQRNGATHIDPVTFLFFLQRLNGFHEVRRILVIVLDDLHALEQKEVSNSARAANLGGGRVRCKCYGYQLTRVS